MSQPPKHHRVRIESHVDRYMEREVIAVSKDTPLADAETVLAGRGVSCALVRDAGAPIGVVSRTDILRAARRQAGSGGALAPLPPVPVGELCKRAPLTVDVASPVSTAAQIMVSERVHRVFTTQDGEIVGVFSTKDLLRAITRARVATRLSDVMSKPAFTIPVDATIALATDRLAQAHVSGLTVVDEDGWPVGFYAQADALAARESPAETRVEEVMNHALICLHDRAELHRAAAIAHAARARRVLVIDGKKAVGVLSPLDFARAVSA